MTFEEEFRTLLQKHGMPFNERSGFIQPKPGALSGRSLGDTVPGVKTPG
jgi:hypothetical protein